MMLVQTVEQTPLANEMKIKSPSMTVAQTGEQMPIISFKGSAPHAGNVFSMVRTEKIKTDNVVPPVVIRNPYKKVQSNTPNIKQFCKPIYTPRSTVRNPYARDSKVEEQKQLVSRPVLTPKPFFCKCPKDIFTGGALDMTSSVALTPHNPKQLFHVNTGHRVSIFHMKHCGSNILHDVMNTYYLKNLLELSH